jgi:hypothetical protein
MRDILAKSLLDLTNTGPSTQRDCRQSCYHSPRMLTLQDLFACLSYYGTHVSQGEQILVNWLPGRSWY